jgi:hypothetical protein
MPLSFEAGLGFASSLLQVRCRVAAQMLDIAASCTIESQPNLSLVPPRQLPQ